MLTVSVNAENPIGDVMTDMSTDTIRQIFDGEITTWDEVDASLQAETINVYIRDLSGGAYEVFQKSVMGDSEVTASEQAFIDYIFSETGYEVTEKNGYIPAFTPAN